MADVRTDALKSLLQTSDLSEREVAWEKFVAGYTRLILHVAHRVCGDQDGAMDGYALVLEQLRADDFKRLRSFVADGRSEFSTWLLVVAQRICLDERRRKYGRVYGASSLDSEAREQLKARTRLANLIAADIDLLELADGNGADPERDVRVKQIHEAVENSLAKLEPRERLLVKLRFEDDLAMPDVARTLELPSRFHAYRMLSQVLERLKRSLASNGVSDGEP
jgi:RNA polymerase sigma factor (sigma-70 family)